MFNSIVLKKKKGKMGDPEEMEPKEAYETSEEKEEYGKEMKHRGGMGMRMHEGPDAEAAKQFQINPKVSENIMASLAPKGVMEKEKKVMEEKNKSLLPQSTLSLELKMLEAKDKSKKTKKS